MWFTSLIPISSDLYLDHMHLWGYEGTSLSDVFIDEVSRCRVHETFDQGQPKRDLPLTLRGTVAPIASLRLHGIVKHESKILPLVV